MSKLFVAVDLPAAATLELARIQAPSLAGIRLAESDQIHLTLHYIGEADVERITAALEAVAVPTCPLDFPGGGPFRSAGWAVTLWAGVRESAELLRLHSAVAAALAREGFGGQPLRSARHPRPVPARVS